VRKSNLYIILFSASLTVILGGLLSLTAVGLKPIQKIQVELDTKKQILRAVMDIEGEEDILSLYDKRTESLVVDINGEEVAKNEEGEPIIAENVNIARQFKKPPEERLYPVFKFMSKENPDQVEAYIFPMYGNGLWNNIWAFLALETDLNTIKGVSFDHVGETPGLGARITSPEIQNRYIGKEIFNDQGELVSVDMRKGERGDPSLFGEHEVDGLSGATLTAKGVNNMLGNYFKYYLPYLKKLRTKST